MTQSLYARGFKRPIDLFFSAAGLIFLSPILMAVAIAIKLTSFGPILFRQIRTGKCAARFTILKFRTMKTAAASGASGITVADDARITALGRILRRYKLDELPQLWNVLTGDMSLVGPRPEVPQYVALYTAAQREILNIRPGITGPDSLAYRDEEILLAESKNPEQTYTQEILPAKLVLSRQYLHRITFWGDFNIFLSTLVALFQVQHATQTQLAPSHDKARRDSGIQPDRLAAFLDRDLVQIELSAAKNLLRGHSTLITGAAGSIGSALARQILALEPAILICLDHDARKLDTLHQTLSSHSNFHRISFVAADAGDRTIIRRLFAAHKIEFVFHSAAHKHLPALESNVAEAVRNNVFALESLLISAEAAGCRALVLISSDKAVNPSSVMGATKRIGELMLASRPENQMRCVSVRCGNVLGSSGSVVPVLEDQLRRGLPLTITHPESKRFFLTGSEAVSLALEAFASGKHGEILILEMGAPIKIVELAGKLIRQAQLDRNAVEIQFTGLRPGEKIEEELFYAHEIAGAATQGKVLRVRRQIPADGFHTALENLRAILESGDPASLRAALKAVVPEYNYSRSQKAEPSTGDSIAPLLHAYPDEAI